MKARGPRSDIFWLRTSPAFGRNGPEAPWCPIGDTRAPTQGARAGCPRILSGAIYPVPLLGTQWQVARRIDALRLVDGTGSHDARRKFNLAVEASTMAFTPSGSPTSISTTPKGFSTQA